MFITFEGIDGSGKSTQIDLLENHFVKRGYSVLKLREPGGTVFSEAIRELLLSKEFEIESITELLLFDAARSHLVGKVIQQLPIRAMGVVLTLIK
jgi:dTMP kinase